MTEPEPETTKATEPEPESESTKATDSTEETTEKGTGVRTSHSFLLGIVTSFLFGALLMDW